MRETWTPPRWSDVGVAAVALLVDLALWGGDGSLRTGGTLPFLVVVAVAAPVFATLTVRDRWPRGVYAVMWVYCLLGAVALPFYQPFTGLLVALHQIARRSPLRPGLPFLAAVAAPFAVNTFNSITLNDLEAPASLGIGAIWAGFAVAVWVTGRFGYRAEENEQLRERHRADQAALAVQHERLRLARELHDSVANSVSAVIMQAAGARHLVDQSDPRLAGVLGSIEHASTQAMRELRRLLGLLRDPADAPGDLAAGASLDDLAELIAMTTACAVRVDLVEVGDRVPLEPSVDHAGYRVAQEALANAVKHGGPGGAAEVSLQWGDGALAITVHSVPGLVGADADSGLPGQPLADQVGSTGLGLPGLAERVAAVGGTLEVSESQSGFVVSASLPLQPAPTPPRSSRRP